MRGKRCASGSSRRRPENRRRALPTGGGTWGLPSGVGDLPQGLGALQLELGFERRGAGEQHVVLEVHVTVQFALEAFEPGVKRAEARAGASGRRVVMGQ